jgi:hypothetical protein
MNEEHVGVRIETFEVKVPRRGHGSYAITHFRKFGNCSPPAAL